MFEIAIENKVLKVSFEHFPPRWTYCHIQSDNDVELFRGEARVSSLDQYCKETGRRVSLTYAIKGRPRAERKLFWTAYFQAQDDARALSAGKQAIEMK